MKQENKDWREEFDKMFPRLGDEVNSIYRYCRLDYPEGDERSIEYFIQSLDKQAEKQREDIEKAYQRGYYEGTLVNNKYEDNLRAN